MAVSRAPEVRFQPFVKALVTLIQQGQADSKGGESQGRRDFLIKEPQNMSKILSAFMNTHTTRSRRSSASLRAGRFGD